MITFLKPLKDFDEKAKNIYLEFLRTTRNSNREYMTRYRDEISPKQQQLWYNEINSDLVPYVYFVMEHGSVTYPIGYGLIHYENNSAFLTAVVIESMRGQGLGKKIFSELIQIAKEKVNKICLEVLETNLVALDLYKSLGFVEVNKKNEVVCLEMECNK